MDSIYGVSLSGVELGRVPSVATTTTPTRSFQEFLLDSIRQVNAMQQEADRAVEQLMSGGPADPAEVLTAVQKADLAFRLMMQIRNKLLQAFQEIQNIRI
ncbi:MAG: flagellar hook-basal body complex protein FliE [Thermoguttaceae bacterium]|nr:flagellar hook-basal body complex protein FliE [Thermoguttaceae bacterium]MDW8037258.1 flagellar hook-basal body complex protein FliE [Thermoguttaceae bacterium]